MTRVLKVYQNRNEWCYFVNQQCVYLYLENAYSLNVNHHLTHTSGEGRLSEDPLILSYLHAVVVTSRFS